MAPLRRGELEAMTTSPSGSAPSGMARLRVQWFGRTVVGRVRTNNEDAFSAALLSATEPSTQANGRADLQTGTGGLERPGTLLAVADGMGGAKAGEVASGMAVTILGEEMTHRAEEGLTADAGHDELHDTFVRAVHLANERIRDEGTSNPSRRGMGTTLTAAWLLDDLAMLAHVGDSRAYLFRRGNLSQITKDQSLVEKLLEDQVITEAEAKDMRKVRNIILQALGSEEDVEVAVDRVELQAADMLVLCTDGLTAVLENEDVEKCLRLGGGLEEVCDRLIQKAEDGGGPDNITVLLGRVDVAHRVR